MSTQTLDYRFRLRRRTAASWASLNEVLLDSEMGLESDTRQVKIGDGTTPWNGLAYFRGDRSGLATVAGAESFAIAGGVADALTAAFTPTLSALVDGQQIKLRAAAANVTTAPTLAVDALSPCAITKTGNQPLAAGDIVGVGHELQLRYVAGATPRWELLNPAAAITNATLGRQTISITAPAGARVTDVLAIGAMVRLLHVSSDQPCRVRTYTTIAHRDADLARASTTDPAEGAGLTLEYLTTATFSGGDLAPVPTLYNGDTPMGSGIPITLDPSTSADTTVTLTYIV